MKWDAYGILEHSFDDYRRCTLRMAAEPAGVHTEPVEIGPHPTASPVALEPGNRGRVPAQCSQNCEHISTRAACLGMNALSLLIGHVIQRNQPHAHHPASPPKPQP